MASNSFSCGRCGISQPNDSVQCVNCGVIFVLDSKSAEIMHKNQVVDNLVCSMIDKNPAIWEGTKLYERWLENKQSGE